MGDESKSAGKQSGGVNISGGAVNVGGDIVGRDKTMINYQAQVGEALRPVAQAVQQHPEAPQKLEALKAEAGKGQKADDGVMAKLVKGIAGLVPGAVSAVVSAFATPILGGIAGPVTKYVLDEIQGK
jgi:hypothetical protein